MTPQFSRIPGSALGLGLFDLCLQKDVTSWLVTIGLEEYKTNFKKNDIKTIKDMETLKSFKDQEIREELNITKPGRCGSTGGGDAADLITRYRYANYKLS